MSLIDDLLALDDFTLRCQLIVARSTEVEEAIADARNRMFAHSNAHDYDAALRVSDVHTALLSEKKDQIALAELFVARATLFFTRAGNFTDESREALEQAIEIAQQEPRAAPIALTATATLGDYWFIQRDPIRARAYYEQAVRIGSALPPSPYLAYSFARLGTVNSFEQNYVASIESYALTHELYQQMNDLPRALDAALDLGNAFVNNAQFDNAKRILEDVEKLAEQTSDKCAFAAYGT